MAAIRSLSEGYTHYVVGPGLPELRAAIAKKLREENGLEYDENCILVTPGGKNAIYLAVQAILNEGDEVLVLDPAWVSYEPIVQAAGGDRRDARRPFSRHPPACGRRRRTDPGLHPGAVGACMRTGLRRE